MITFKQLYEAILAQTHPAGLPENLVVPYRKLLIEALIYIQRNVDCFQQNNTQLYPYCSTFWNCRLSLIHLPSKAIVKRLYTVRTSDFCSRIDYSQVSYDQVLCESKQTSGAKPELRFPSLPVPTQYPDPALDRSYRARYGLWALDRERIYLSPYIHSSETVVVEWDGLKRSWVDADLVDDSQDLARALKLYIQKEMARDYEKDITSYQANTIDFQDALRDLIYDCNEQTRIRRREPCTLPGLCTPCGPAAEAIEVFDDEQDHDVFANIGDFGDPTNGTVERDVANLVNGWSPSYITTNGDNQYETPCNYQTKVGDFYGAYITNSLNTNRFWPALGNHDWDECGLTAYKSFFVLPGNGRYYELVRGPIHWFILDTEPEEPDGISVTSVQAEWLHAKLALSKAPWKIVISQNAPYTSDTGGGNAPGTVGLRWPYKEWGATLVISGDAHQYEKLVVDGFTYIVNGAGGRVKRPLPSSTIAGSVKILSLNGALKGTVTCDQLKLEFWDSTGVLQDTTTFNAL